VPGFRLTAIAAAVPALVLLLPSLGAAAGSGRVAGSAPPETVVFLAPRVPEIREFARPRRPLRLEVRGGFVVPRVSWVVIHSPVAFEAHDSVFADVAAYVGMSDLIFRRKFVLAGDRFETTLDRPGIVTLESEVRPLTRAYIYVTPTSVAVVSGADGRYALENVEAGLRRFTAWNPEKGISDREVKVEAGKATSLDIDFPAK